MKFTKRQQRKIDSYVDPRIKQTWIDHFIHINELKQTDAHKQFIKSQREAEKKYYQEVATMLKTETNSPAMGKKVLTAARKNFKHYQIEDNRIFTVFEHGQWWVKFFDVTEETDRTFSVCDAEGVGTIGGFSFEEV